MRQLKLIFIMRLGVDLFTFLLRKAMDYFWVYLSYFFVLYTFLVLNINKLFFTSLNTFWIFGYKRFFLLIFFLLFGDWLFFSFFIRNFVLNMFLFLVLIILCFHIYYGFNSLFSDYFDGLNFSKVLFLYNTLIEVICYIILYGIANLIFS